MWGHSGGCDFANRTCSDYMQQRPAQPWFLGSPGTGCTRDRCASATFLCRCISIWGTSVSHERRHRRLQISVVRSSGLGCYSQHRGISSAHRCAREGATEVRGVPLCRGGLCGARADAFPACSEVPGDLLMLVRAGGFGEALGQGSRCLEHSVSVQRTISGISHTSRGRTAAGCYTVLCKSDGTMSILLDGAFHMLAMHYTCACFKAELQNWSGPRALLHTATAHLASQAPVPECITWPITDSAAAPGPSPHSLHAGVHAHVEIKNACRQGGGSLSIAHDDHPTGRARLPGGRGVPQQYQLPRCG